MHSIHVFLWDGGQIRLIFKTAYLGAHFSLLLILTPMKEGATQRQTHFSHFLEIVLLFQSNKKINNTFISMLNDLGRTERMRRASPLTGLSAATRRAGLEYESSRSEPRYLRRRRRHLRSVSGSPRTGAGRGRRFALRGSWVESKRMEPGQVFCSERRRASDGQESMSPLCLPL